MNTSEKSKEAAKAARLKAALRDNLKRRKAAARKSKTDSLSAPEPGHPKD